ncbi:hypothetical protein GGS24DRAFT_510969 [Hypoxylon argillaceum]|nr:hypothetical protein GGS24DRAFT_510969 [Hypoxylon argillaceum]
MESSSSTPASAPGRPLGNLETFFRSLSDQGKPLKREHWTIHLAMTLEFSPGLQDPIPYLKCAWQVVRLQHPELGAFVNSGHDTTDLTFQQRLVPSTLDLDAWAQDTFIVFQNFSSADETFSGLHTTATPTCNWLPASSQLVIRASHWRTDGVGLTLLGHSFMTALAAAMRLRLELLTVARTLGLNHSPTGEVLIPSTLEELARTQSRHRDLHGREENPILAAGADALVAEFLKGVPSIGLPTIANSETAIPSSSSRTVRVLDVDTTARLVLACRGMGFTVTSAVHAAIVCATASFPQHPLAKCYAAFVPVDLRRALGGRANQSIGLYFSGLPVYIDSTLIQQAGTSFEQIARQLGSVYARDHVRFWRPSENSDDDEYLSLLDLVEAYVRRTTILFNTPPPENFPPVQTPDLSSLGKVERYIQPQYHVEQGEEAIKVANIWIGTEMLNRSIQFHVWSWMGCLNLGVSFNTSFYKKDSVAQIVDLVIEKLLSGCKVNE